MLDVAPPIADPLTTLKESFPACYDLLHDAHVSRRPTAGRIYIHLCRLKGIFESPQSVKIWAIAHDVRANNHAVISAFNLLTERGYVIDCGRGYKNTRMVLLPLARVSRAA